METENTSGQRASSVIPQEIKRWNWGAFLLSWIWSIGNQTWIGLLSLVPYLGVIMAIILGIKGNEWAWQNRQWKSVTEFKETQRKWAWWGLGVIILAPMALGIVAAVLFPIMSQVRNEAKIAQCTSNLRQIGMAIQMFKQDNRKYPDLIAGPALNGVPLDKRSGPESLYPEYIKSVSILNCPSSGITDKSDTVPDPMFKVLNDMKITNSRASQVLNLYKYSSYDCQKPPGMSDYEAHYSTLWKTADYKRMDRAEAVQYVRQLKWRTPPLDTVVTWCSCHRRVDQNGKLKPGSIDLVLFLDGSVKRVPSEKVMKWTDAWKNAQP